MFRNLERLASRSNPAKTILQECIVEVLEELGLEDEDPRHWHLSTLDPDPETNLEYQLTRSACACVCELSCAAEECLPAEPKAYACCTTRQNVALPSGSIKAAAST